MVDFVDRFLMICFPWYPLFHFYVILKIYCHFVVSFLIYICFYIDLFIFWPFIFLPFHFILYGIFLPSLLLLFFAFTSFSFLFLYLSPLSLCHWTIYFDIFCNAIDLLLILNLSLVLKRYFFLIGHLLFAFPHFHIFFLCDTFLLYFFHLIFTYSHIVSLVFSLSFRLQRILSPKVILVHFP